MSRNLSSWIPPEVADPEGISVTSTLRREFGIVFRRRRLIAATVGVFMLVAATYNYGARPLYESRAVVSLDEADASPLKVTRSVDTARLTAALENQLNLLKSPELALVAVSESPPLLAAELSKGPLGDWKDRLVEETKGRLGFPREHGSALPDQVAAFRSRLSVEYRPPSKWVTVRFRAYDSAAAVAAVNRLLEVYVAEAESRTKGATDASLQKLEGAVSERQERVVETLGKLKQFQKKEGLESVAMSRDLLEKELARLEDALITARETGRARRSLLEESLRVSPDEMMAIPSVREDREVAEAGNKIADLESRLARATASLGDRHPEIVGLRSELDLTRDRLEARLDAIKEATTRDFRMATREEGELKREVANVKRRLSRLEGKSVEQGFIQQRAEAGQQAVGELIARSVRQSDEEVFFAPRVLQRPQRTRTPTSPQRARNFQYALGLGLLVGLGLAWLLAHLDESLKTPEDVKTNLGVALLGVVPKVEASEFDPLASEEGDTARLAEVYRVLRTNLVLGVLPRTSHKLVLVTSSREGEGKTSTSCGLAVALARGGQKVLVVDIDLRRASLSRLFAARGHPGVSDAVGGRALSECIVATPVEGLSLMPGGTPSRTPGQLLNGDALRAILDELRPSYDWIVCDAPPVLAVADATVMSPMFDSVIVVIGANATPVGSVRATLEQLHQVDARVSGVVLNRVDLDRDSHYYKYYYASHYTYYSHRPEEDRADSEDGPSRKKKGSRSANKQRG